MSKGYIKYVRKASL